MPAQSFQPDGLPAPPTFSHVMKAGSTVYLAGQVSQDENGNLVGAGDFTAQATQVFENMRKALAAVGADLSSLVKITVFLTDPRFREAFAPVRSQYLTPPMPTSTLVVVAGLALPEYLIEIEGIAYVD